MTISAIKMRLHQFIDSLESDRAKAIYTLFEAEMDTEKQRKALIRQERENYLKGEWASYTVDQVKAMARDKEKRNGLSHGNPSASGS